jgi:hypothetical protein
MKKLLLILLCLPMIGFGQNKFKNMKNKTSKKNVCPAPNNLLLYVINTDNICKNIIENELNITIKDGRLEKYYGNNVKAINKKLLNKYDALEVTIGTEKPIFLSNENNFTQSVIIDYSDNHKIYAKGVCGNIKSDSIKIFPFSPSPAYKWNGSNLQFTELNTPPVYEVYPLLSSSYEVNLSSVDWIIALYTLSQKGNNQIKYNILNDFEIDNNENKVDFYTDKYLVPYTYKPVIEFTPLFNLDAYDEAIKNISSCLGVDAIIKEKYTSSKLSRGTEIVNPLGVLLDNQPAVTQRIYKTEEDVKYSYTLIKKDLSHRSTQESLDKYDLILKLSELKEKGIISEKEFQEEKKKLLEEK